MCLGAWVGIPLRLADLAQLSYQTYQTTASSLRGCWRPFRSSTMLISRTATLAFKVGLVFEPSLATGLGQPVQNGIWQSWDTLDVSANGWWATGAASAEGSSCLISGAGRMFRDDG
ncbi:MAG: hypothetical protein KatS3mg077_0055 [Candidatus Binatia bacterium]|nr:MAG: hypothetical protein KatS3mg077_0055 [Candidatus Binatia bacterium]